MIRRVAPFLVIALAVTAFMLKDRWMAAGSGAGNYLGYVEGETTLIASPSAGRLITRPVHRGEQVTKGAALFQIDPAVAEAEVARLAAVVVETKAQLDNLKTGKRELEQDVVRAQRREAEASLKLAEQELQRTTQLLQNGTTPRQRYDQAVSQVDQMRARVQQLRAQEAAGDLGGRAREIDAAAAKITEAQAMLDQAKSKLADLGPTAPFDALVENAFFDVGEWVSAGQPIVSLLRSDKLKLRFFVPEEDVALARNGATVMFTCDTCRAGQTAVVTFVAPRAEFTPPVIYSQNARRKLVFLVEARPQQPDHGLRSGMPVEVARFGGKP